MQLSLSEITYLFSGKHSITPGAQHLVVCAQAPGLIANDNCVMPRYIILTFMVLLAVDNFIIRFEVCMYDSKKNSGRRGHGQPGVGISTSA